MTLIPQSNDLMFTVRGDWTEEFLVGYGPSTRVSYASDLKSWMDFAEAQGFDPQRPTRAACAAFSAAGTEVWHLSPATVARRISALSSYLQFGVDEGYVADNPASRLRRPKVSNDSQSTGLSKDELDDLLVAAELDGPQSYALIVLLAKNGLRISEALALDWSDFSTERGHPTISITRKGGKIATVPLNKMTDGAMSALNAGSDDGPVFLNNEGERMNRFGAWRLVKKLSKEAVPEKADDLGPHSLRHTFVTHALDAGATLHDVQDAAGHADPRTTQRYNRARHSLDSHPTYLLDA